MRQRTFSLPEVLVFLSLFILSVVFTAAFLSESMLQRKRTSNRLAQVSLERVFLKWELSGDVTPTEYNKAYLTKRTQKNFINILTSNPMPEFGEPLAVNTTIPPTIMEKGAFALLRKVTVMLLMVSSLILILKRPEITEQTLKGL